MKKRGKVVTGKLPKAKSVKKASTIASKRTKKRFSNVKNSDLPALTSERLSNFNTSVETLRTAGLKKGRHLIGSTGWINPDKKGLSSVSRILRPIRHRGYNDFSIYSFGLYIRFNDPTGKEKIVEFNYAGVPRVSDRDLRVYGNDPQVLFEKKIRRRITHKIFEAFALYYPYPNQLIKGKMSAIKAKKTLKNIKEKRGTKFRFVLYRDIHNAEIDTAQHLSGIGRHGGRFKGQRRNDSDSASRGKRDIRKKGTSSRIYSNIGKKVQRKKNGISIRSDKSRVRSNKSVRNRKSSRVKVNIRKIKSSGRGVAKKKRRS